MYYRDIETGAQIRTFDEHGKRIIVSAGTLHDQEQADKAIRRRRSGLEKFHRVNGMTKTLQRKLRKGFQS
jgi:hypothetical protein